MRRIFHIPAHLDYVSKLTTADYTSVPSPSGAVLSVADLLALGSWDFFDVLHLHTVELATPAELVRLGKRLRQAGKPLVFTVHDLVPNIETDHTLFDEKTRLAIKGASAVVTLTYAAAEVIATRFAVRASVIPHGFAARPECWRPLLAGRAGFLVFGAFRPNRDLLGVVRVWRLLPANRPPLQILVRSVSPTDRERYAAELTELQETSRHEAGLTVTLYESVVSSAELVDSCRGVATLVLPYRTITHSGQLELARDMNLAVVAPDVPTLRAQISETAGDHAPCVWFPPHELGDTPEFARHLIAAIRLSRPKTLAPHIFPQFRRHEHRQILDQYRAAYNRSCT